MNIWIEGLIGISTSCLLLRGVEILSFRLIKYKDRLVTYKKLTQKPHDITKGGT